MCAVVRVRVCACVCVCGACATRASRDEAAAPAGFGAEGELDEIAGEDAVVHGVHRHRAVGELGPVGKVEAVRQVAPLLHAAPRPQKMTVSVFMRCSVR
jgi:hypothetical protein